MIYNNKKTVAGIHTDLSEGLLTNERNFSTTIALQAINEFLSTYYQPREMERYPELQWGEKTFQIDGEGINLRKELKPSLVNDELPYPRPAGSTELSDGSLQLSDGSILAAPSPTISDVASYDQKDFRVYSGSIDPANEIYQRDLNTGNLHSRGFVITDDVLSILGSEVGVDETFVVVYKKEPAELIYAIDVVPINTQAMAALRYYVISFYYFTEGQDGKADDNKIEALSLLNEYFAFRTQAVCFDDGGSYNDQRFQ